MLMLFNKTTFIGIDPRAGKHPMTYVAFDKELQLLAISSGDIDEIIAFVSGQESAFVCISAPRRPNQNLMKKETVRASLAPAPRPGRWLGYRVAEYLLSQINIRTPRTPSAEQECPRWMQTGFSLFRRLEALGYRDYPGDDSPKQIMETYPQAAYTVLLGHKPFPKRSLEGRIQRQLILYEREINLSDPMRVFEEITRYRLLQGHLPLEGLHTPDELDALLSAYTAWLAIMHPEQTTAIGHPAEGQIILPASDLKSGY